jgi:hypothetical protein
MKDELLAISVVQPAMGAKIASTDGVVRVAWTADSQRAQRLLFTILYSNDGGRRYVYQAFAQTQNWFDVILDRRVSEHTVKIVASDGAQSSLAVVRFSTA